MGQRRWWMALGILGLVAGLSACSTFSFQSTPGEPIGQGRSGSYNSTNADILGWWASGEVDLNVSPRSGAETWYVDIDPPVGQWLRPGVYADARWSPDATHAGIKVLVAPSGRSCSATARATISITALQTGANGSLTKASGSIVHTCYGDSAHPLVINFDINQLG